MKLLDIRFCKPIIQVFRTVTTSTNFKNETVNVSKNHEIIKMFLTSANYYNIICIEASVKL